ncbi:MAG: hypothetical protein AB8V50_13300 [Arsenophonus endosymbiont of Dermacentor nuttalli]
MSIEGASGDNYYIVANFSILVRANRMLSWCSLLIASSKIAILSNSRF